MISNLGLYPGVLFIRVLNNIIVECISSVFRHYSEVSSQIATWLADFRATSTIPIDTLTNKSFEMSSSTMIKLGTAITMKKLIKKAMRSTTELAAPGIEAIIESSIARLEVPMTEREQLICEITSKSKRDDLNFIESLIHQQMIQTHSNDDDFIGFMFYLGLLLNSSKWDSVKALPNYEAITGNLHLYPIAMNQILRIKHIVFPSIDDLWISDGIKISVGTLKISSPFFARADDS